MSDLPLGTPLPRSYLRLRQVSRMNLGLLKLGCEWGGLFEGQSALAAGPFLAARLHKDLTSPLRLQGDLGVIDLDDGHRPVLVDVQSFAGRDPVSLQGQLSFSG